MTINDSADARWLEIDAALLCAPPNRPVDGHLFAELGACDLWEWAVAQRGPVATNQSPWLVFSEDASVEAVRAGLPVWTGILALHPTPATKVQRLTREVPLIALFAEHAREEWDGLLEAGADRPFPTVLAYVPRDGDWGSVLVQAQGGCFDVPAGTTLQRIPAIDSPETQLPGAHPIERGGS